MGQNRGLGGEKKKSYHVRRLRNVTWCLHFLQPTQHFAVLIVFIARLKARYIYWWRLTPCLSGICIDLEDRSSKLLRNMSNYLTRDPFAVFNVFTVRLKALYINWWRLTPCLSGICIDLEDRSSTLFRNMSNYLTRDPFAVFNAFTARLKVRYINWWRPMPCLSGICIDLEDRSSKLLRNMSNYLSRDPFAVSMSLLWDLRLCTLIDEDWRHVYLVYA